MDILDIDNVDMAEFEKILSIDKEMEDLSDDDVQKPRNSFTFADYLSTRELIGDNYQKEVSNYCDASAMPVVIKDVGMQVRLPKRAHMAVSSSFKIGQQATLEGLDLVMGMSVQLKLTQAIQLGPYVGSVTQLLSNMTNGSSWNLGNGRTMGAADGTISKWMRYVNYTRNVSPLNLVTFKYKSELYYRIAHTITENVVCRTIQEGKEFLMYYESSRNCALDHKLAGYSQPKIDNQLKEDYACKHCHIGFISRKFRDGHERTCRSQNKKVFYIGTTFACPYCNVLLSSKENRDTHQNGCSKNPDIQKRVKSSTMEGSEGKYHCRQCDYQTNNISIYKSHMLIHDKENAPKYICATCSYKTVYKRSLKNHLRIHASTFGFICQCCAKSFNQKKNLDHHYMSKHSDKTDLWMGVITHKINECPKCSYKTIITSHFKEHLLTHNCGQDGKKYHCKICEYRCIQKSDFTKHLRLHVGQLPFVCPKCRKKCNQKKELDGHIVTKHSDVEQLMNSVTHKIHCCEKCSFKTIFSTNFKKHLKSCKK